MISRNPIQNVTGRREWVAELSDVCVGREEKGLPAKRSFSWGAKGSGLSWFGRWGRGLAGGWAGDDAPGWMGRWAGELADEAARSPAGVDWLC